MNQVNVSIKGAIKNQANYLLQVNYPGIISLAKPE